MMLVGRQAGCRVPADVGVCDEPICGDCLDLVYIMAQIMCNFGPSIFISG